MFVHASMYKRREANQLDVTECFIAPIICSTCFGHSYAHHQEVQTTLVLSPHMVCNALVAGGQLLGAEQQAMCPGRIACCSAPNIRHNILISVIQRHPATPFDLDMPDKTVFTALTLINALSMEQYQKLKLCD